MKKMIGKLDSALLLDHIGAPWSGTDQVRCPSSIARPRNPMFFHRKLKMSSQSEVMHCYEQIATLSGQMLVLARTGQWGELPAHETLCSNMVEHLKVIEPLESLLQAQVARKYQLLSRIVSNEAEIFSLVMPQLRDMLKRMAQQDELKKACGQANDICL